MEYSYRIYDEVYNDIFGEENVKTSKIVGFKIEII